MKQRFYRALNRNTFMFVAGLLGVAHETLLQHAERPTLLILFAAMMGMPAFLTSTEVFPHEADPDKRKKQKKIEEEAEHSTEDKVEVALEEQGHGKG
jgi:Na+-transporting methylmalonyl-CoA/oxaloacetate decarboxylase gamma subunit